jgi:hypothetical protein
MGEGSAPKKTARWLVSGALYVNDYIFVSVGLKIGQ